MTIVGDESSTATWLRVMSSCVWNVVLPNTKYYAQCVRKINSLFPNLKIKKMDHHKVKDGNILFLLLNQVKLQRSHNKYWTLFIHS